MGGRAGGGEACLDPGVPEGVVAEVEGGEAPVGPQRLRHRRRPDVCGRGGGTGGITNDQMEWLIRKSFSEKKRFR